MAYIFKHYLPWSALWLAILLSLAGLQISRAQTNGQIEVITGYTEPGRGIFYTLPDLKKDDILSVYVEATSGNLDPMAALTNFNFDRTTLTADFNREVNQALADGRDPLAVVPEFTNKYFLAWDDDAGQGYDAAFEFKIPANGDYHLLILGTPAKSSFGDFRLTLGLNAPDVLTGQAESTGDILALPEERLSAVNVATQEITGTLTAAKSSTFYNLNSFDPNDTLSVFIEATSGDLKPVVILADFGGKPLASGNFTGQEAQATLQHTFDEGGKNFQLQISAFAPDDTATSGDYRLLVGINNANVLSGQAEPDGKAVLFQATPVNVGLKMQQITGVDQKAENFSAVASLRMTWNDPALAFNPDTCQCRYKTFTLGDFVDYVAEKESTWPAFTLYNQQGNRWSQNQLVLVSYTGDVTYFERFTTTFQAPDFDFRQFPFDTQQFYIRVDMIYPEEYYVFVETDDFSEVGTQLGEEEWVIVDHNTALSNEISSTRSVTSRFSFGFTARRHLNFYIIRIFVPLVIIIIVSWIIFFLKDYGKRVEAASANLLLFIAFNFTISDDLPRLGYLTFLDTMMVSTFIVTGLVLVFNVYLKRLEVDGKTNMAYWIDKYTLWIYPIAYLVAFGLVTYFFA